MPDGLALVREALHEVFERALRAIELAKLALATAQIQERLRAQAGGGFLIGLDRLVGLGGLRDFAGGDLEQLGLKELVVEVVGPGGSGISPAVTGSSNHDGGRDRTVMLGS